MRLDLSVRGDEVLANRLRSMASDVEDARDFFRRVRAIMLRESRSRWGSSGYGRWAPLEPSTVRKKASLGQSPRALRATGTLERALTVYGAPGQIMETTPTEFRFGIDGQGVAFYGQFHDRGDGVTARPVLRSTARLRAQVLQALRDSLGG